MFKVDFAKGCIDKDGFVHPQASGYTVIKDGIMAESTTYRLRADAQKRADELNAAGQDGFMLDVPQLIQIVKEQQARIEKLERRLEALVNYQRNCNFEGV